MSKKKWFTKKVGKRLNKYLTGRGVKFVFGSVGTLAAVSLLKKFSPEITEYISEKNEELKEFYGSDEIGAQA